MVSDPFLKRIAGIAGCALAVVCTILSFEFGMSIHWAVAAGLVVLTFLAAYTPAIAHDMWVNHGREYGLAATFVAMCVVGIDITTSSSTLSVHRVGDSTGASVANVKYEDTRNEIADLERQLRTFEAREAELSGKQGWSGMQASAAYDGLIAAKKLAIANESKRVRCGTVCERLTNELAELQANQAVSAAHERDKAMYAATQAKLANLRAEAKTSTRAVSSVETQNVKLASIMTMSRKPGEDAMYWTDTWLGVAIGSVLTLAACFFNFVAHSGQTKGLTGRLLGKEVEHAPRQMPVAAPHTPAKPDPLADYTRRMEELAGRLTAYGHGQTSGVVRAPQAA